MADVRSLFTARSSGIGIAIVDQERKVQIERQLRDEDRGAQRFEQLNPGTAFRELS